MKAWQVPELGEPRDVLRLAEVPDPVPGPGQVLVKVLAAAANFPDVLMCRGGYQVRPPLPYTPGIELCGEVLAAGETLLVHAAAGGVGSGAVQLGKAAGARVICVAGGERKAEAVRALGADVVIDRNTQDFVEVVKEVTGGRGADVIYDPVGGDTYARSTKCVAFEGRILIIGFAGGQIQSAALNHALVKNYSIVGLHWGLYQSKNPQLIRDCHAQLTRLVADGAIKPLVSERLGLDEVPAGLQRLADGGTVGRVVFVP